MKLSFYTRHCKKCLMLTIEAKVNERQVIILHTVTVSFVWCITLFYIMTVSFEFTLITTQVRALFGYFFFLAG